MAEALQLNAMSARSDPKDIKKQVRELEKE